MKRVLQQLGEGKAVLTEAPRAGVSKNGLLVSTASSVVSPGTERMLQEFGKASWVDRVRKHPDKVRMVLDKVRTDGLRPTLEAVQAKLDQPIPLGYCNAGTVFEVGGDVEGFQVGDRVASNGAHAEFVSVPQNLCARIPDNVDDESAAFTVLGAIALQGIRLVVPTLGETVVVTGLGLIGQITVQLLRAQGCRVIGIDTNPVRVELARSFGAKGVDLSAGEDPIAVAQSFTRGRGVDAVLITAATQSSEPVHQAATMSRKRGRIVLVGVTGLELSRADFYEKELSFQVSCSYGPGRYDPEYEDKGHDYPVGFVRWTAQRNFEAVLDMMASGALDLKPLITHRFAIDEAEQAYELLGSDEPHLGIVLNYPQTERHEATIQLDDKSTSRSDDTVVVGFIGAGNHATRVLMPAFDKAGAVMHTVADSGGIGSVHAGQKFGFQQATTDVEAILANPEINSVVIATRHDSHAELVCRALQAGKHVFVEKPLALTLNELDSVRQAWEESDTGQGRPVLMVGFNRRYAPHVVKMKSLLNARSAPKVFVMTVNAGAIPPDHWTQDSEIGGGRIIGEACHFVDLLRYLSGSEITSHHSSFIDQSTRDTAHITLDFADGSTGVIHYLANGHKSFPKERLEVFCQGGILQLDNFRKMRGYGWPGFRWMNLARQDKGQLNCVKIFSDALSAGKNRDFLNQIFEVSRVTLELAGFD